MYTLAQIPGEVIPLVAISGGVFIGVVGIISGAISQVARSAHRERARREIAAYVAEGSMTPDEAERLLKAGALPACGSRRGA